MNNSFWDTVKGQKLADVLIATLPKLTKEKRTKQYIAKYGSSAFLSELELKDIQQELDYGSRIVAMTHNGDGYIYVVYEREE